MSKQGALSLPDIVPSAQESSSGFLNLGASSGFLDSSANLLDFSHKAGRLTSASLGGGLQYTASRSGLGVSSGFGQGSSTLLWKSPAFSLGKAPMLGSAY